ncbi:MAG TPA: hypothetical protein VF476_18750 [Chitinophagaceae bacterium]
MKYSILFLALLSLLAVSCIFDSKNDKPRERTNVADPGEPHPIRVDTLNEPDTRRRIVDTVILPGIDTMAIQ